jgi:hypothetical protein
MQNLALKLEEAIRHQDLNELADDALQGTALAGIGVVLLAWIVMLAMV